MFSISKCGCGTTAVPRVDRDGDREHHMLDSTLQNAKTLGALEKFQN